MLQNDIVSGSSCMLQNDRVSMDVVVCYRMIE